MTPFVIIGMPRTGSSWLRLSCAQHPQVVAYDELFHPVETERHGSHRACLPDGRRVSYVGGHQDPLAYLYETIWNPADLAPGAVVGFKLFADHVRCEGTGRLLERLASEVDGLRVLHISRDDLLQCWVSRQRAERTGEWFRPRGTDPATLKATPQLEADPSQLRRFFDEYRAAEARIAATFAGPGYLRVRYEQLVAAYQPTMDRVFAALGVEPVPVTAPSEKQNTHTPRAQIVDFATCAGHFRDGPYAEFFT